MSRTRWLLSVVAIVALASAGCASAPGETAAGGGGAGNPSAAPAGATTGAGESVAPRDQAVKFAQCMRDNGVKAFPDPDASGALTIDAVANGSSIDTNTASFQRAITACRDLEPPGFTGTARSPDQQKAALRFAQCIRDNGVKDFPDPAPDAPLVDTNLIPSTGGPGGLSILNAAMKTCRAAAGAAGVKP